MCWFLVSKHLTFLLLAKSQEKTSQPREWLLKYGASGHPRALIWWRWWVCSLGIHAPAPRSSVTPSALLGGHLTKSAPWEASSLCIRGPEPHLTLRFSQLCLSPIQSKQEVKLPSGNQFTKWKGLVQGDLREVLFFLTPTCKIHSEPVPSLLTSQLTFCIDALAFWYVLFIRTISSHLHWSVHLTLSSWPPCPFSHWRAAGIWPRCGRVLWPLHHLLPTG